MNLTNIDFKTRLLPGKSTFKNLFIMRARLSRTPQPYRNLLSTKKAFIRSYWRSNTSTTTPSLPTHDQHRSQKLRPPSPARLQPPTPPDNRDPTFSHKNHFRPTSSDTIATKHPSRIQTDCHDLLFLMGSPQPAETHSGSLPQSQRSISKNHRTSHEPQELLRLPPTRSP